MIHKRNIPFIGGKPTRELYPMRTKKTTRREGHVLVAEGSEKRKRNLYTGEIMMVRAALSINGQDLSICYLYIGRLFLLSENIIYMTRVYA